MDTSTIILLAASLIAYTVSIVLSVAWVLHRQREGQSPIPAIPKPAAKQIKPKCPACAKVMTLTPDESFWVCECGRRALGPKPRVKA